MEGQGRVAGKVAVVTGAGTGIGEAIAKKLALEGAAVVVNGRPGDPIQAVADEINRGGGRAIACEGDVANEIHAVQCLEVAKQTFGALDILVANAGVMPEENLTENYSPAAINTLIHSNIVGTIMPVRAAIPYLRESRGNIVAIGSEAGILGEPNFSVYGGTKGFVHAFIRGVAHEYAKSAVRANVVCPGPIDTAMLNPRDGEVTKKTEMFAVSATLMGRKGTPEEVANVVAFLASEEASYVTGALWSVDGGMTMAKSAAGMMVPPGLKDAPEGELEVRHQWEGRQTLL